MFDKIVTWTLAIAITVVGIGMLYLILNDYLDVLRQDRRVKRHQGTPEILEPSPDPHAADVRIRPTHPPIPTSAPHGLCGPQARAETSRSLYTWKDDSGTLNISDQRPADRTADQSRYSVDWADGGFQLNLVVYSSPNPTIPPYFKDQLRSHAHGIIRSLAQLSGQQSLVPVKLDLTVFATKEQYDQRIFHDKEGSSGVYSTGQGAAAMYMQNTQEGTLRVALHEITHALNCNVFGLLPAWLNEGLANYFEGMLIRNSVGHVRMSEYVAHVARTNARSGVRRMLEMVNTDDDTFWRTRADTYPLSESLVFFLLDSTGRKQVLVGYLEQLASRKGQARFVQPAPGEFLTYADPRFEGGSSALLDAWRNWLMRTSGGQHTWRW